MILKQKNTKDILLDRLEEADTFLKKFFGLLLKPCPKDGEGLMFRNCNSIHMFFMRYAIGVIYIDDLGKVVKVLKELKPWRVSLCRNASMVIEVAPLTRQMLSVNVGDELEVVDQ